MTDYDRMRLFEIRCASKQGRQLSEAELDFCRVMLKKYPKEYNAMNREVFIATMPFGSTCNTDKSGELP